jgi:hypothetical protein
MLVLHNPCASGVEDCHSAWGNAESNGPGAGVHVLAGLVPPVGGSVGGGVA